MVILNEHGDETRETDNGRLKWVPLLLWIFTTLVSVTLAYGAVTNRLSVLEVKYDRVYQDISEIKQDVKQLLRETR